MFRSQGTEKTGDEFHGAGRTGCAGGVWCCYDVRGITVPSAEWDSKERQSQRKVNRSSTVVNGGVGILAFGAVVYILGIEFSPNASESVRVVVDDDDSKIKAQALRVDRLGIRGCCWDIFIVRLRFRDRECRSR